MTPGSCGGCVGGGGGEGVAGRGRQCLAAGFRGYLAVAGAEAGALKGVVARGRPRMTVVVVGCSAAVADATSRGSAEGSAAVVAAVMTMLQGAASSSGGLQAAASQPQTGSHSQ